MAPSKLRKAIGAVKDRTSISLAKVGSSSSLSDLDVAIVKATRHEEYPSDERYVREILSLTSYSRAFMSASVSTISRRLNKTKNWVVALKTLTLVHRLLSEGDASYEQEMFFATRHGTRLLNMSDFRDNSGKSNAWDYSAFVRAYALYLDEQLEFRMQRRRGKHSAYSYRAEEDEDGGTAVRSTPVREMKIDAVFSRAHHLMQLLERFLACRPTGAAKDNRVVIVALYPIVKESFQLCYDITEIMGILVDKFMLLEVPEMVKVYEIFCRVAKQYDELDGFYVWCKTTGVARASEYPDVEQIPQKKLDMMNNYIREKSKKRASSAEPKPKPVEEPEDDEAEVEEEMSAVKALPPPEGWVEEMEEKKEEEGEEEQAQEPKQQEKPKAQEEGDLLDLSSCAPTVQEHGDKLALALFDGGGHTPPGTATTTPLEAFKESSSSSGDWEMALVQSASHLSNQKANLPGGFDDLILDGMYQQGAVSQVVASSGLVATGSASSVALGSAGRPAMLALPAPPPEVDGGGGVSFSGDPFAASIAVAPPAYVQMSDMEKKQRLLVDEQVMWQQYARDGMQGQVGLAKVQQQNPYART